MSNIKTALFSAISAGLKTATAKEGLLYEGQTLCGLARVTQDHDDILMLRFGKNGSPQSIVKPGNLNYLGLPYAKSAMIGQAFTEHILRILEIGIGGRLNTYAFAQILSKRAHRCS